MNNKNVINNVNWLINLAIYFFKFSLHSFSIVTDVEFWNIVDVVRVKKY